MTTSSGRHENVLTRHCGSNGWLKTNARSIGSRSKQYGNRRPNANAWNGKPTPAFPEGRVVAVVAVGV